MTTNPVAASPLPLQGATLADRPSRIRSVCLGSGLPGEARWGSARRSSPGRIHLHGARRAAAGFTLVEVLVALLILAVVAGMSWQGVDAIIRSRDLAAQKLEQQLRLQSVIGQWEADLQEVQDSTVVPALAFDGANLRLTRRSALGMQVVVWSLRGGAWTRWAGPVVTRSAALQEQWLLSQQLLGNEPGQLRALTGVSGWQVYFWRGNAWSNAQSSADNTVNAGAAGTAGGTVRQLLPGGVRLVLAFAEGSGLAGKLTRDLRLAPQGGS